MKLIKKEKQKGQSLWEVILALGIASLIALGLVKSTTSSIKSSRYSADESRATALAQAKLNEIKNQINQNPNFWSNENLLFQQGEFSYPDEWREENNFCIVTKLFNVSSLFIPTPGVNALMVKISVDVFWDEKTSSTSAYCETDFSHSVHLETYVTN